MSAVLDSLCPFCGRPRYLWGGETCDVCDRDASGVNDREESVALSTVDSRLLIRPEEKGWELLTANVSKWAGLDASYRYDIPAGGARRFLRALVAEARARTEGDWTDRELLAALREGGLLRV